MSNHYEPGENDYLIFNYKAICPKYTQTEQAQGENHKPESNQNMKINNEPVNSHTISDKYTENGRTARIFVKENSDAIFSIDPVRYTYQQPHSNEEPQNKVAKSDMLKRVHAITENMEFGTERVFPTDQTQKHNHDSAVLLKKKYDNLVKLSFEENNNSSETYDFYIPSKTILSACPETDETNPISSQEIYSKMSTKYKYHYWEPHGNKSVADTYTTNMEYMSLFDNSRSNPKKNSITKCTSRNSQELQYILESDQYSLIDRERYKTPTESKDSNTEGSYLQQTTSKNPTPGTQPSIFLGTSASRDKNESKTLDPSILLLSQLGFSIKNAAKALEETGGNTSEAIALLLESQQHKQKNRKCSPNPDNHPKLNKSNTKSSENCQHSYMRKNKSITDPSSILKTKQNIARNMSNKYEYQIEAKKYDPTEDSLQIKSQTQGLPRILDKARMQIFKSTGNWFGIYSNKNAKKAADSEKAINKDKQPIRMSSSSKMSDAKIKKSINRLGSKAKKNTKESQKQESSKFKAHTEPERMVSFIKPYDARYFNSDNASLYNQNECSKKKPNGEIGVSEDEKKQPPIPYIDPSMFLAANDAKETAIMHYRLNKFKVARDYFNDAIKFMNDCPNHPFHIILYNNMASTLYKLGNYKPAVEHLNKAIDICKAYVGYSNLKLNSNLQQSSSANGMVTENLGHITRSGLSDITVDVKLYYKKCVLLKATVYEVNKDFSNAIQEYKTLEKDSKGSYYESQARSGIARCNKVLSKEKLLSNIVFDPPYNDSRLGSPKNSGKLTDKWYTPNSKECVSANHENSKQITKKKAFTILSSINYQNKVDEWKGKAKGNFIELVNTIHEICPELNQNQNQIQSNTSLLVIQQVYFNVSKKVNPDHLSPSISKAKREFFLQVFKALNEAWAVFEGSKML